MIPLLKAWGFESSPIGPALGVGLIAIVAVGLFGAGMLAASGSAAETAGTSMRRSMRSSSGPEIRA